MVISTAEGAAFVLCLIENLLCEGPFLKRFFKGHCSKHSLAKPVVEPA